ncbi:hypothetical protein BDV28DRAFT_63305 [Aspergillus coremiiformis]|uniref:Uncharacterized protein n=1 Tax=Aspergillus coremiiformis TaxID=138285 RepID=A0A5N6YUY9_9EURO|nr:hypothetical protein BDV28DRAFT_63305 [Aspergillus coremiiformis]
MREAKQILSTYDAFNKYCNTSTCRRTPLSDYTIPDLGTFSVVEDCQLEALGLQEPDVQSTNVLLSPAPPAFRTRQKTKAKALLQQMDTLQLGTPETPSKPPKGNPQSQGLLDELEEECDSSEPESTGFEGDLTEMSLYSPAPKEAHGVFFQRTDDEEIVNIALQNFLNALSVHFEGSLRWSPHRVRFTFESGSAVFEARTDGYLRDNRTSNVIGIVEVKAALRTADNAVRMQESAEIISWITDPRHAPKALPGRSFIVSQDRHEIYVSFAEYNIEYLKYLKGKRYSGDPFLTMHEYGPWHIGDKKHMSLLGRLILALVIRARKDRDKHLTVSALINDLPEDD